jgi:hypothetical protein
MQADLATIDPPLRNPDALEALTGIRYLCLPSMMGRSQEVRHRILIPAFGGSNPPAPASAAENEAYLGSLSGLFRSDRCFLRRCAERPGTYGFRFGTGSRFGAENFEKLSRTDDADALIFRDRRQLRPVAKASVRRKAFRPFWLGSHPTDTARTGWARACEDAARQTVRHQKSTD